MNEFEDELDDLSQFTDGIIGPKRLSPRTRIKGKNRLGEHGWERLCSKCLKWLPIALYGKTKRMHGTYLQSWCKGCQSGVVRESQKRRVKR